VHGCLQDFMQCVPFPEYTHPDGQLNVASHLATDLVKPDLGPKSYIATGRCQSNNQSTTSQSINQSIQQQSYFSFWLNLASATANFTNFTVIHFDVLYFLLLLLLSGTYALLTCTSDSLLELCKASVRLCADHMYKCARSDSD